ncbi:MAG: helix-turn-helix domain-containing protein [Blautia sp.]|nr:helix-turn-helix domain-containing protein [Blautia sp.]
MHQHPERSQDGTEQLKRQPQAGSDKRSYSVADAAEILGVSRHSVYKLCSENAFKTVRVGNMLRISRKSFDEWLDGNT